MTRRTNIWIALLWSFPAGSLWAIDLATVQQEPNLERRSQLAIECANSALDAARTSYQANDLDKTRASLDDVGQAVSLSYDSLKQTGKEARRDTKFFKRTELAIRQMLRRIEGMAESMNFEDRTLVDKLRERVGAIHENLLQDIMGKKK
jgi:methyl-accepting chemotaxis protein